MTADFLWQPNTSLEIIKKRATLLWQIRDFMDRHDILEVDTPVLSHFAVSDPYIQSMVTKNVLNNEIPLYLQTSPEYCMKRLLAAGSKSIYQIAHVFRDEESSKQHHTEFTMLEWYRSGFDYYQLMDDVTRLLLYVGVTKPKAMTYAEVFLTTVQLDPHTATIEELQNIAGKHGWDNDSNDHHALLDFIFSEMVIKNTDTKQPLFIYDYPKCMAALATLKQKAPYAAERFELFVNGMEIANGFNELCDVNEQRQRFDMELSIRKEKGLSTPPIDSYFLEALESGLPKTAGVAIGIERLLMVLSGKDDIKDVIAFTLDNN